MVLPAVLALSLYMPVSLLMGWAMSLLAQPLMRPAVPKARAAAADRTVSFFANIRNSLGGLVWLRLAALAMMPDPAECFAKMKPGQTQVEFCWDKACDVLNICISA